MAWKITKHLLNNEMIQYHLLKGKDHGLFPDHLPDTIVLHYTALPSLQKATAVFDDPQTRASAHLLIGRDGAIIQLLPFNRIAWHAGQSRWQKRQDINRYGIGIELDNAGRLLETAKGYQAWWGGYYPEDEVYFGTHRHETIPYFWHGYTAVQMETVTEICRALYSKYDIKWILGHEEIAPGRKSDPGPAFPLDEIRSHFDDRSAHEPEGENDPSIPSPPKRGYVLPERLNIRSAPDAQAQLQGEPLLKNNIVDILGEQQQWLQVQTTTVGWVRKEYIQIIS